MSRTVLITGGRGFIGARLTQVLAARGDRVHADEFDLFDFALTRTELARAAPDVVIHLAAISHAPACDRDPALAFRTNVGATAALIEVMRHVAPAATLVFASTAQVYAAPTGDELRGVVMTEARRIAPQNLYARTKWQGELLIEDASRRDGLQATVLRLFNHTHKSQSPELFLPHIHRAILDAQRDRPGQRIRVPVGNLALSRDIGSIDDLVAAFLAVLDRQGAAPHDVFNVCSGTAKRLSTLATELARRLGADVDLVTDPARVRPNEPEIICGSHARLTHATGWEPRCGDDHTLIEAFLAD